MMQSFLLSFTAIFVAMDIIGAVPMYLSITRKFSPKEKKKVINTSMMVALIVAAVFVLVGRALFRHLGITIADFKIAGGLILLLVSLADLLGGPSAVDRGSGETGIVPLAVPMITGPGVLTTLVLQIDQIGYPITLASLALNYLFAWIVLLNCDRIQRYIGKDGTVVVSKIAALLLAAIAVAMMRSGVLEIIGTIGR